MTREEAIKNIKEHCYFANLIPQAKEALDMAIEALEQEPCEDCISKKAVLDKINEVCFSREQNSVDFRVAQGSNGQRDLIINFIENLPIVKPKSKTDWIPVSERLPEDNTLVLVTVKIGNREPKVRSGSYYMDRHFYIDNGDCWESRDEELLAWMPLPEPYKGDEDD